MEFRTSIRELCRWLKAQWVAEVPDDLAICEFECRETECSFDGWANCWRRISETPKGPGRQRHSANGFCQRQVDSPPRKSTAPRYEVTAGHAKSR